MTLYIYAPYLISAGQTVNYTSSETPAYAMGSDLNHITIPTFTNAGTVNVNSPTSSFAVGMTVNLSQYTEEAFIWNQTGAVFRVTGAGQATAIGIWIQQWGNEIVNDGLIEVTGNSRTEGIENDVDSQVEFTNNGTLRVTSQGQGVGFTAIYGAHFENHGLIDVTGGVGEFSPSVGVQISGATIVNTGTISVHDASGRGVGAYFYAANSVPALENSGLISADYALRGDGIINNSGTLQGIVQLETGADQIHNTGHIDGAVRLGAGDDLFDGGGGYAGAGVFGEDGNDTLTTGSDNNLLSGDNGYDLLDGNAGDDTLLGGTGNDTLLGDPGADMATGGTGRDKFAYAVIGDLVGDIITDFDPTADRIDLSTIAGLSFIGSTSFSGVAGQVRYSWANGNTNLEVDGNGDGAADAVLNISSQFSLTETSPGSMIFGQSSTDFIQPFLIFMSPANLNYTVPVDANIVLKFYEPVRAGSGNIKIYKSGFDQLAFDIPITDTSQVTISGDTVTVNPSANLLYSQGYYIAIAPDVILDIAGNGYAGIRGTLDWQGAREWYFSTAGPPDTTPPQLTGTFPTLSNPQPVDANLQMTFGEYVKAGSGDIEIHKSAAGHALVESIPITDSFRVTFSGTQIYVNPSQNLEYNTDYYVVMPAGAVLDLAGNPFAGISSTTTFRFITLPLDNTAPVLFSTAPLDNATNVSSAQIALSFDERVFAGSGNITIHSSTGPDIVVPVNNYQVQFSNVNVYVYLSTQLAPATNYYVTVDSGAIKDQSGNAFAGISSPTVFNFKTKAGPTDLTSDFDANAQTDILWQNTNGQPAIWLMNGASFAAGVPSLVNPGIDWHIKTAGDFNADGYSDILWQNADGQAAIWFMRTGFYAGAVMGANPGPNWQIIGAGDFNGDGCSDILWQKDDGLPCIWLISGTSVMYGASLPNLGPSWHVIGAGDFNGDRKSDILWQNENGDAGIWLMNSTSIVSGSVVGPRPGQSWHVKGAGDFDGDGKSDILWQNDDGQAAIWFMNGLSVSSGGLAGPNPSSAWQALGAGDFNGDGKADILWQHNDGTPAVWLMDSTSLLSGAAFVNPGTSWHVLAMGN